MRARASALGGFAAAGLLLACVTVSAPAGASAPAVSCRDASGKVAAGHLRSDTPSVDATDAALTRRERTRSAASLAAAAQAPSAATMASLAARPVTVPVYVHVLRGSHRNEQTVGAAQVRRVMQILRDGFGGRQSTKAARSRIVFTLKKITFTKNDAWYHAQILGKADRRAKATLHRGGAGTLNLYIGAPTDAGTKPLGYARFPWQYARNPVLDGVTVAADSLPGGKAFGYNSGDTVIHEVGHWLGLFHTFESRTGAGCDPHNDRVDDTPAEKGPNFSCLDSSNLCDPTELSADGLIDPALNFMDYTLDACMRLFTPGQIQRMNLEFATYRR